MKTLVLCVDRDDDLGAKTGIKGPVVGRDENLHAANKLGLMDPEDSDVNTMLAAVSVYDELVKSGTSAEVATICGDARVGTIADRNLTRQLDEVLEWVRPDRAYLVSDGAEDEAVFPMIASRVRVDHVRRIYIRQAPAVESAYYMIARAAKEPKVRNKLIVPIALSVIIFAILNTIATSYAVTAILLIFGIWMLLGTMPITVRELLSKPADLYRRVERNAVRGNVSLFFGFAAFILLLIGIFFGLDQAAVATDYLQKFLAFVAGSVFWLMLSVLTYEGGKVANAYLQRGRVPRHVLVVAATFIALGLLALAFTQTLGTITGQPTANVTVILGTVGLAILLVILSGLTYRSREDADAEDLWRY